MELVVTQLLNGCFLGGPKNMSFTTSLNNSDYHITIDQLGKRVITITSLSEKYKDYLSIYYLLTSLLMLFDGVFYPVISAFDGTDITASWERRELRCYHSADFILTYGTKLIDFENVLSDTIFQKWNALRIELDIIHNMVLYCLSSVEIPKDIQCAFMIEAFEGLIELICAKDSNFIMPSVQKG